jgi:bifunctional NMN adenylyltransferase/nudix hydrolase
MQNLGFLIGRFQPLHAGHRSIIRQAAKLCKHLVVIVGSANAAPSVKNPWSYLERKTKINLFLYHEEIKNVTVVPVNDYRYNDAQWQLDIGDIVEEYKEEHVCTSATLFGFDKPDNKYLTWFDDFEFINLQSGFNVCATDVRNNMFSGRVPALPVEVMEDYDYFIKEREQFSSYPYKDTLNFCCSDSVVVCNGHILLIKRIKAPGRNHWALPGGFKNNTPNG